MQYIIFLFFFPLMCFSQDIRFTYNYNFVSDTLKKDFNSNEIVVLDFYNKEQRSVFTGIKHIISDSIMTEDFKKGIMSYPDTSTNVRYVVEKFNNKNLVFFYTADHMPDPVLKVIDERQIKWQISNERLKILSYSAQKATTFFAGRHWTAWFTSEIPISEGPYKFHGLPGLILKILDETKTHSYEIVSVQKLKTNFFILNDNAYKNAKQITLKEFEKIPDNPYERFKILALAGELIFKDDEDKQVFLKDVDAQIKESKKHDNNPIELLDKK